MVGFCLIDINNPLKLPELPGKSSCITAVETTVKQKDVGIMDVIELTHRLIDLFRPCSFVIILQLQV